MESSRIVNVFTKLFNSYLISDEIIRLKPEVDTELINLLDTTISLLYPQTLSTITPSTDRLRYNAYHRMFGYQIIGEGDFPKTSNANNEYEKIFEELIKEATSFILDEGITTEKLGDPSKLAVFFNQVRSLMLNRKYNTIDNIALASKCRIQSLEAILENDALMVNQLSIKAAEPYNRLIELGERLSIPVPDSAQYFMDMARRMNFLLDKLVEKEWTPEDAKSFVEANNELFKSINTDWANIRNKNLQQIALAQRRR